MEDITHTQKKLKTGLIIRNFNASLLKIGKTLYKNIATYYIGYIT